MVKKISGRAWLSIVTAVILGVILFTSRHEIVRAWELLHQVDLTMILLLVPLQFLSYYATGESMFAYLRAQGRVKHISVPSLARLSLEMNFVNHVLPSAGVSGVSYMGWRLKHYNVPPSKSTAAQIARVIVTFGAYAVLLVVAVLALLFDGALNRLTVTLTAVLVLAILGMIAVVIYLLENSRHFEGLAMHLMAIANGLVRIFTFGKRSQIITSSRPLVEFFEEVQKDYRQVRAKKKMLAVPFIWGFVFNLAEIAMFYCAFLALGHPINPAPLVVAYGLAGAAGIFMVTPGGAGVYEIIMVGFLVAAGIDQQVGIAAIVLARVLLMAGTVIAGYAFYQQAIIKHGKRHTHSDSTS